VETAPYDPDAELCDDMGCPFFVKQERCQGPESCPRIDGERKRRGAVYMLDGDDREHFLGLLPRTKRH
jgi:hypothetical protein